MVVRELTRRCRDADVRRLPPVLREVRVFHEAGVELAAVLFVDRHTNHAILVRVADLHDSVVIDLAVRERTNDNREILTLLVETVMRVAARVVLVLGVGFLVDIVASVHGNVAVVARELRVKTGEEEDILVCEGGKRNGKSIETV